MNGVSFKYAVRSTLRQAQSERKVTKKVTGRIVVSPTAINSKRAKAVDKAVENYPAGFAGRGL